MQQDCRKLNRVGTKKPNMSKQINLRNLDQAVLEKASSNENFRKAVIKNASKAILEEFGYQWPKGMSINVLENTFNSLNLVLPLDPSTLNDGQYKLLSDLNEPKVIKKSFSQKENYLIKNKKFTKPSEIPANAQEVILTGMEIVELPT